MSKFGFGALNDGSNPGTSGTSKTLDALKLASLNSTGRVLSVVMDDTHPRYNELGGSKAIGAVELVEVSGGTADYSTTVKNQNYKVAFPLQPGVKNYPLINEIVYLVSQPTKKLQQRTSAVSLYYISVVNLWNHPHHNAIPYSAGSNTPANSKNYQDTVLGSTNKLTDSSGEIKFGNYFIERPNIYPLQPFEGDIIYEGRWGNSIRFGSTIKTKENQIPLNTWSEGTSTSGDPITLIRNGQGTQSNQGWIPIEESINNDDASIYLTSTQKIPLKASSTIYNSYQTAPTTPDQYAGKQVILNSGRLIFNTTQDHLLLSSAQSIGFNAVSGFNFDTKADFTIDAPSIKLGGKNATEPILKGDALVTELQKLINQLIQLTTVLVAVPQTSAAAQLVLSELPKISANIALTKSKINKIL